MCERGRPRSYRGGMGAIFEVQWVRRMEVGSVDSMSVVDFVTMATKIHVRDVTGRSEKGTRASIIKNKIFNM